MRPRVGIVANARDRPNLLPWYLWHWPVLLLAPHCWVHPLGLAARLPSGLVSRRAGRTHAAIHRKSTAVRRSRCAAPRGPVSHSAAVATAVAVCMGVALLVWVPTPAGTAHRLRRSPSPPGPPPAGSSLAGLRRRVQQAFAQVHAGVAAIGRPQSRRPLSPPNPRPRPTDAATEHKVLFRDGCMRNFFQDGQPECAAGDITSTTTWPSWPTPLPRCGTRLPADRPPSGTALEMLAKAGCPLHRPAHHQPHPAPGIH